MQYHLFISGFVQGVGYRQFVKSNAQKLDITGWVKNLPDGRVEAVVQGKKDEVTKLIELCQKGPLLSEVESVDVREEEIEKDFSDFSIEH